MMAYGYAPYESIKWTVAGGVLAFWFFALAFFMLKVTDRQSRFRALYGWVMWLLAAGVVATMARVRATGAGGRLAWVECPDVVACCMTFGLWLWYCGSGGQIVFGALRATLLSSREEATEWVRQTLETRPRKKVVVFRATCLVMATVLAALGHMPALLPTLLGV
jgi:hypothetical protein